MPDVPLSARLHADFDNEPELEEPRRIKLQAPFPDPQVAVLTEKLRDAHERAERLANQIEQMTRSRNRWRLLAERYAADPDRNRELGLLKAALTKAAANLDAEHRPERVGANPGWEGCIVCGPADGSWPCVARMVADDLRTALEARQ